MSPISQTGGGGGGGDEGSGQGGKRTVESKIGEGVNRETVERGFWRDERKDV